MSRKERRAAERERAAANRFVAAAVKERWDLLSQDVRAEIVARYRCRKIDDPALTWTAWQRMELLRRFEFAQPTTQGQWNVFKR